MKVEPSMPPNGVFCSARPPIQRSMASTPVTVTFLRSSVVPSTPSVPASVTLPQVGPVLLRKSRRSFGSVTPPSPNTSNIAAARLATSVSAPVIVLCVP
ncbi:hypothetical protein D3C71_1331220 [compost metagenome]